MMRFLPGIFLLQAVTGGLAYLLITGGSSIENNLLFALIALDIAFILLMALWFSSLARQNNFAAMESLKEAHAKEREKLRVNAERQKNRLVNKKHKEILRETKRAYAMANIKAGTVVTGLVVLGGVLLYTQFITFGSMLLTAGGGGLLGYLARAKQENLFRRGPSSLSELSPKATEKQEQKKLTKTSPQSAKEPG
ncbi:MAG: hypothetical protein SD837_22320 [Candidatus Electrothrix scaldis]|jgi:hypothetical protein|nr:MAG: hypothetical protein SD837_22320 [Candidatus Electrothrix sp. GW3-3]